MHRILRGAAPPAPGHLSAPLGSQPGAAGRAKPAVTVPHSVGRVRVAGQGRLPQLRSRGRQAEELGRDLLPGQPLLVLPLVLSPSAPRRISAGQTPTQHGQGHPSGPLRPTGARHWVGRVCSTPPGSRRKTQDARGPRIPCASSERRRGEKAAAWARWGRGDSAPATDAGLATPEAGMPPQSPGLAVAPQGSVTQKG